MSEQTSVQNSTESPAAVQQQPGATDAGKPDATVLGDVKFDKQADATGADKGAAADADKSKPADDKAAETPEQKAAREAAEAAAKVPEKYEFKLPDGIALDQAASDLFTPKFKELGLTQAQAQGLVDTYVSALKSNAESDEASFAQQTKDWETTARADKEIGGAKFDESKSLAHKTMSAFGSPELVNLMNTTGFGNHPELIRFFARVGKSISEDTIHRTGQPGAGERSLEDRLYGKKAA
ncbi:MAG TPA: hypothetical protein VFZ38_10790 [Vicinamibacterales bacterium]